MNKTQFILVAYNYRSDYENSSEFEYDCKEYLDLFHPQILKESLDMFVSRENKFWPVISFGSCHEDLFNIFGYYIAEGTVNYNNIKVILFDDLHNRIDAAYDSSGYLDDSWTFGFFNWKQ